MNKWGHSWFSLLKNRNVPICSSKNRNVPIRQHGFILMPVILLITLLATVIFLLTRDNASGLSLGASEAETTEALYVAEAGIQHALSQVRQASCSNYLDINNEPFGAHSYSAVVSPTDGSPVTITATGTLSSGAAQTLVSDSTSVDDAGTFVMLQPSASDGQDAHIFKQQPDRNYGADTEIHVAEGGESRHGLLRFDLSSVPTDIRILSAVLELKSDNINGAAYVDVHRVLNDWAEGTQIGSSGSGASWDERDAGEPWGSAGGDYDPTVAATALIADPSDVWHLWDITTLVDGWINRGVINNGLILVAQSGLDSGRFHSSDDADTSLHPRLSIQYACECGKVCTPGVVTGNYCDADFAAEIKDFEFDWGPGTNKLTGIAFLPQDIVVNGATIPEGGGWIMADDGENALFVTDATGDALTDFSIEFGDARGIDYVTGGTWVGHLVVADKADDRIYFVDLDGNTQANIFVKFIAEEPFGISYIGETGSGIYDDHLAYVSKKNGAGEIYIIDQAGVLQKTINVDSYAPEPQGIAQLPGADKFMIVDLNGVVSIVDFDGVLLNQYNTEAWDLLKMRGSTIHPLTCEHVLIDEDVLTINGLTTFDASGSGGARVLMVVGNDSSLTSQENAKKVLIESWGYVTELISDDANNSTYDAAIASNDVVFIGEDASSGQIGDQLVDAPIGVITEEANQVVDLGLSSSVGWGFDSVLDIDDNGHYITLPFATGPLPVLDVDSSLAYLSGTVSTDVRVLGSISSDPMLSTLEATATMVDSQPSAGRRALLPWGGSNFQLSDLNTDGKTIFRRALEWGVQQAPRCDADYVANNVVSDFPWMPGTGTLTGIDYLPEGLVVNAVSMPAGGGWIMSDNGQDRLFVTDLAGNPLTDFKASPRDPQGVALVDSGFWRDRLAIADKDKDRLYYVSLNGSVLWSFDIKDITDSALGLGFIGATASAVYDDTLVISSDKNPSGGGTATLYMLDQWGTVLKTIDVEAFAPTPQGVTHVAGADKLIVADKNGTVSVVDFDGNLKHQYSALALGGEELNDIGVNPMNCEHAFVSKKPVENIVSVNRVTGSGPRYIESFMPWSVVAPDTWETANFEIYGVPENSVLEIAIINTDGNEMWGGARTKGSSLERRIQLHENSGGQEIMVMHVQTDSLGRVELYSDKVDKVEFVLLGYWPEASYAENMQSFKAGADGSYETHALSGYGVAANDVTEMLMVNNSGFNKRKIGARTLGASEKREVELHEADSGGSEMMSFMTVAGSDGNASIEVYAKEDDDVDFYLLGHWSTPPGTYSEAFEDLGTPSLQKAWEDLDLGADGVPANAVAQIVMSNRQFDGAADLGVRSKGSLVDRLLKPHKPELGGEEVATMHVNADENSEIQWYDEDLLDSHKFYLLGWWVLF